MKNKLPCKQEPFDDSDVMSNVFLWWLQDAAAAWDGGWGPAQEMVLRAAGGAHQEDWQPPRLGQGQKFNS